MSNGDGHRVQPQGRILVVDDEAPNRLLLRELLESHGYGVVEAGDGREGLALAEELRPDVVLLDVMMPAVDGFEVCRRLKGGRDTRTIPVLMVSALAARRERLEGMRAGANDFVTKPIDTADLLLRVRNAFAAKQLYDQMEGQYIRLRELEGLRDTLVHMLVHDVRSPLNAMLAYVHLLGMDAEAARATETAGMVAELKALGHRMSHMVDTVLDVSRMEAGQMPLQRAEVDVGALIREEVRALGPAALARVRIEPPGQPIRLTIDQDIVGRVLANLIGNALKFSGATLPVVATLTAADGAIEITVRDTGPGIPAEELDYIFEKFGQARAQHRNHGTGLGLTFCKLAVEAHGGSIGARSTVGMGSTFWLRLPAEAPVPAAP